MPTAVETLLRKILGLDIAATGPPGLLADVVLPNSLIGIIRRALQPVLTVPAASVTLLQGHSGFVPGVSLAEASSLPGETFTVTLSAQEGVLAASGVGVSGSGGKKLTIAGTLAQVNADLATLSEIDNVASPGGTFELITVNAADSFGYHAPMKFVSLTAYSLSPVLTVPTGSVTLLQGHSKSIGGVSLAEASSLPGETFTVTLSAQEGLLAASGAGVSGSGGKNLIIAGTLAQVNADLATLSEIDNVASPGGTFDLITVNATDSFGNQAPMKLVSLTNYSLSPALTVPTASVKLLQGHSGAIAGVSLAEASSVPGETFSVTLSAQEGVLAASGAGVSGSGGKNLTIAGTLAQVNADLATLRETDKVASPGGTFDLITVNATDSFGNTAPTKYISLTDYSLSLALTAPTSLALGQGVSSAISGVSLTEVGNLRGETFAVTVSDQLGQLSATGPGVTGSGGKSLKIAGTLAQVNADLATLSDLDNFGSPTGLFDTITLTAKDSFGNQTAKSIAVTSYSIHAAIFGGAEILTVPERFAFAGATFAADAMEPVTAGANQLLTAAAHI